MNNKLRSLFDMLLLLVNSVGIVGALLEVAGIGWSSLPGAGQNRRNTLWSGIPWESVEGNEVLEGAVFWGGLLLFCVLAVLLWRGIEQGHSGNKKRIACRAAVCVLVWIIAALWQGKGMYGGLLLALENSVGQLNNFYQVHIAWPDGVRLIREAGWPGGAGTAAATLGLLFFLFPFVMLSGLLWKRSRKLYLLTGNVLWFAAACTFDAFPGFLFLFLCVLGLVASLVQKDFEEAPTAGFGAVMAATVFAGAVMGLVYRFLLPVIDERYEEFEEERVRFYRVVNEQWLSGFRNVLSGYGLLPGIDVTGAFNRSGVFSYTAADAYRVTVDRYPQGVLYLRGFVGGTYGESEWEAQTDRQLEHYYRENGLELPENFALLMNMSYEAAGEQDASSTRHITLEELGGRGSYSLYPYGSLLTEKYQVHGDGSVERGSGGSYGFAYRTLTDNEGVGMLTGQWETLERQYRRYVYDNFLEYPGEALPQFTEWLEQEEIGTDSIGRTVVDIMRLLERQAVYNLDAGRNPADTDFVEYFLFDSQEGYCVHFASAAVLALRYFGIPARYVTGYAAAPSEFSRDESGSYSAVLTGMQAHAWAEIYLDALGWVPVEMTPGAAAFPEDNRIRQLSGLGFRQAQLSEEEGEEEEEEGPGGGLASVDDEEDEEEEDETAAQDVLISGAGTGQQTAAGGLFGIWAGICAVLLAVLMCVLILWFRGRMKRRWRAAMRSGGTGERIFLLYGNLKKAVRIAGCPGWWADSEEASWQEFRTVCPKLGQEEYQAFCRIMEKSSFGNAEPSAEELQAVWTLHDRTVGSVYAGAPFYRRMLFGVLGCHVDSCGRQRERGRL